MKKTARTCISHLTDVVVETEGLDTVGVDITDGAVRTHTRSVVATSRLVPHEPVRTVPAVERSLPYGAFVQITISTHIIL